jgi:hypothetical protein
MKRAVVRRKSEYWKDQIPNNSELAPNMPRKFHTRKSEQPHAVVWRKGI